MADFEFDKNEIEQKLNQLGKEIQTFVGNIIRDDSTDEFSPLADILEMDDIFMVRIDLPGMQKKDIKLEWTDRILTIRGERKQEIEHEDVYLRKERKYGSFQRSFSIPEEINKKNIKASFSDGVLCVTMKRHAQNDRSTEINVD